MKSENTPFALIQGNKERMNENKELEGMEEIYEEVGEGGGQV